MSGSQVVRIRAKVPWKIRLKLSGPTSRQEGRALAETLNALIAQYNTRLGLNLPGAPEKITATTSVVSAGKPR